MNTLLTILRQKVKASDSQAEIVKLSREIRQTLHTAPDTLIRDIRLFFNYKIPKSLLYLNRYCDLVLSRLVAKNFLCADYHHLYIRVADTKEDALAGIVIAEAWHTYGVAVLKEKTLLKADPAKQQELVLNALKEGLLDIATLDKLDKSKIIEAISEAKEIGLLSEILYKTKENKKIRFTISTKTLKGQTEEEIYFTIVDKESNRISKWTFGQENIFLINAWFGTIHVTNKKITIKPRANMDLVLKGKQKIIELDVVKELADPAKVVRNNC